MHLSVVFFSFAYYLGLRYINEVFNSCGNYGQLRHRRTYPMHLGNQWELAIVKLSMGTGFALKLTTASKY
jgi:hypothetical protein